MLSIIKPILNKIITRFNVQGVDYAAEHIVDDIPVEGSANCLSSGGAYADKSNSPAQNDNRNFTAGGAYADKTNVCTSGESKNFTSDGAFKYFNWLLGVLGFVRLNMGSKTGQISENSSLYTPCFHNGRWVVGGYTRDSNSCLWVSDDGKVWDCSHEGRFAYPESPIAFGNGLFVGANGFNVLWSTDGLTWNKGQDIYDTLGMFNRVLFNNGLFVAACSKGVAWSSNGKDWTLASNIIGTALYFADGLWQLGTASGAWWSSDGKNWTQSSGLPANRAIRDFCFGNNIWVCALDNTYVYRSNDGKTWVSSRPNAYGESRVSICYANGIFLGCKRSSSGDIGWSSDGNIWRRAIAVPNVSFTKIMYSAGICACASSKGVWWSSDGKNWTQDEPSKDYAINILAANDNFFIAFGRISYGDAVPWWSSAAALPPFLPD